MVRISEDCPNPDGITMTMSRSPSFRACISASFVPTLRSMTPASSASSGASALINASFRMFDTGVSASSTSPTSTSVNAPKFSSPNMTIKIRGSTSVQKMACRFR